MKDTQDKTKKPSYDELLKANDALEKRVEELETANRLAQEKIQYLIKLAFGRKAEQKSQIDPEGFHQMSLFDEVDVEAKIAEIDGETEKVEVAAHERKARKKNSLVDTGLPEAVVKHDAEIPEGVEDYQIIGHDETRHLVLVPARMYVRIDLYPTVKYIGEDGEPVIVTAKREESEMLKGTIASPELVSKVIHDKFVMHNPLYRQEQEFLRNGVQISRMDLCNYIRRFAEWAKPLHRLIAEKVKGADNVRADETTLNVIELNGTKARLSGNGKSKYYVWLFATAEGHVRAFDYVLGPGRDHAVPRDYFPPLGHVRYLQSDGYEAYSCPESSDRWTNIPCMAHIRRKFAEVVQLDPKLSSDGARYSSSLLGYIGSIYTTDRAIREACGNDYGRIKTEREQRLRPMFDRFFGACDTLASKALPQGRFAKALAYALNRKAGMMNLFLDGRITLDNNYAEREGIKDLVIGRKNWLFADTRAGADITCEMFSIIQTAMANGLDPYRYVEWLIRELPQPTYVGFDYSRFLPWSEQIPEGIRTKK